MLTLLTQKLHAQQDNKLYFLGYSILFGGVNFSKKAVKVEREKNLSLQKPRKDFFFSNILVHISHILLANRIGCR